MNKVDELSIVRAMEPHQRLCLKMVGDGLMDFQIATAAKVSEAQARMLVDETIRTLLGDIEITAGSRQLVASKWREIARHYDVDGDGELVVRNGHAVPAPEPPSPTGTAVSREADTDESLDAHIARYALVGRLSPFQLRYIAALAEFADEEKIAQRLEVQPRSVATYMSTVAQNLGLRGIPEYADRRRIIIAMHAEWVRHGSVRAPNLRERKAMNGHAEPTRAKVTPPPAPAPKPEQRVQSAPAPPATPAPKEPAPMPAPVAPAYATGQPVSLSIQPQDIASIRGIPVALVLGVPGSAEEAEKLMLKGYTPEIINEYLWPDGRRITTLILCKRGV